MTPLDPPPAPRPTARLLALGLTVAFALAACGSDDDATDGAPRLEEAGEVALVEHDYVIPAGTGDALDAGEDIEILPEVLEAEVGETIRIVNDDDRGHVVGVFFVVGVMFYFHELSGLSDMLQKRRLSAAPNKKFFTRSGMPRPYRVKPPGAKRFQAPKDPPKNQNKDTGGGTGGTSTKDSKTKTKSSSSTLKRSKLRPLFRMATQMSCPMRRSG